MIFSDLLILTNSNPHCCPHT